MKTHEAEAILKYCADIPRRLTIIRRQCAALDDEVDTLKGINMDGMPGGGLPGDSTAAMACKMDELGIGDRLRSLERQQALLKSDEATIRGQIDRLDSVHNLILTEYYIGHKKWDDVQTDTGYSVRHLKRLRNVALLAFGRGMEQLPECPALLSRAYNVRETRSNFEQFLGWSEDGEMVAYEKLRRGVEDIYGVGAMVERVKGQGPIFGSEF